MWPSWIYTLPFCFCWKSPATRHLADSMVLTMFVERTLRKRQVKGLRKAAALKTMKTTQINTY